jgi:hypothetical protein
MQHNYYISSEWFALKDFVRALAGAKCEYCLLRPAEHLHHLRYDRFGSEHPADVFNICKTCHEYLHGRLRQGRVRYKSGSPFHCDLLGGELLEYAVDKREEQWAAYRERLEAVVEVTGDGADLIAQGEAYFGRIPDNSWE